MQGNCSHTPFSRLQKYGGAQECKWQAISAREGPEERGPPSLLGPTAVVPSAVADLLHPIVNARQPATARTSPSLQMPPIWER
jgi:hypothetical protein